MAEEQMWIAGEWCAAENGETSDVLNPATGDVMATVPKATVGDVNRCVAASREALNNADWKAMDPAQRGRILNKMAAVTYAKAKELAVIESSNNGKTFREALSEIRYGAWTLEYFAGLADKIEGSTIPVPGPRLNYTLRQPLGRHRSHRSVELPTATGAALHCSCSRCRVHGHRQTCFVDPAFPDCMEQSHR